MAVKVARPASAAVRAHPDPLAAMLFDVLSAVETCHPRGASTASVVCSWPPIKSATAVTPPGAS